MPKSETSGHTTRLALLPLENLSGQVRDGRLARGFEQDLVGELARFHGLSVIAADSVAATEPSELVQKLDVGFLIKGSVRRNGKTLRLSLQLVEAETGQHLWAGRYDEEQLPVMHDEIAVKVANALAINVDQARISAARRHVTNLRAYDSWLLGMEALQRGTPEADAEARRLFENAIEEDPHFARAHSALSLAFFNDWSCQAWKNWEQTERDAHAHALRAEALDPDDPSVQAILARIEQYRRQFDSALARLERIKRLAPNDARILIQLAFCLSLDGRHEEAWETARRALDLNPVCPGWYYAYAATPLFFLKRFAGSLEFAAKSPPRSIVDVPAYQAAANAFLGNQADAGKFLLIFREGFQERIAMDHEADTDELLRWLIHVNPYRRNEDLDLLLEGLRLAGLSTAAPVQTAGKALQWPIANVFRCEGNFWTLSYGHQVVQMPQLRGLQDIARLLGEPGCELACSQLDERLVKSEGMAVLDGDAKRAYRARLGDIEDEMQEANAAGNAQRALRLEEERDALMNELRRATGLGGRTRETGATHERARSAVTWRIRHAVKKIAGVHPALGAHLKNSIRTGSSCSYHPEQPVDWQT